MKLLFSLVAMCTALFTLSNATAAEPTYITCSKLKDADIHLSQLYSKPLASDSRKVATDIVSSGVPGIMGMFVEKPSQVSYVIKPDVSRVENLDGTTSFGGGVMRMSDAYIEHVSSSKIFRLNRLTGDMSLTLLLAEENIQAWKKLHGGEPPSQATWLYKCSKSKPAL